MIAGRRRLAVVALAVALLAAAGGAVVVLGGDGGELGPPPRSLDGFRIEYRVELLAAEPVVNRRVVSVRRPFDGRDDIDPGSSVQVVDGQVFTRQGERVLALGPRLPQVPPGDVRLHVELDEAIRFGLAERRADADRRVAGRPCAMYRFGSPLGDPLKRLAPGEHADLCIDDDGLVLSEAWRLDGELLRRTVAVHVDPSPPPAADLAAPEVTEPDPVGTSVVEPLDLDDVPDTGDRYWVVDEPPWGFELVGRARSVVAGLTTGTPVVQDVVHADTYLRGPDFVGVEHREASFAGEAAPGMEEVDGGRLGTGELRLTPQGPEIRFDVGASVVTVRGTVPVPHLLDFARRLRAA